MSRDNTRTADGVPSRLPSEYAPPSFNQGRLAELMIYISSECVEDRSFGMTKLYKLLFFSDFEAMVRFGRPLTGAVYQHLPNGPAPHQALPTIESLGSDVTIEQRRTENGIQKRVVPQRAANTEEFSPDEMRLVDEVVAALRHLSSREISDLSHKTMAWKITSDFEEIPYAAAFLAEPQMTADDVAWLRWEVENEGRIHTPAEFAL